MTELTFRKSTWPDNGDKIIAHIRCSETDELHASLVSYFIADETEAPYVEPISAILPAISLTDLIDGALYLTWEPA